MIRNIGKLAIFKPTVIAERSPVVTGISQTHSEQLVHHTKPHMILCLIQAMSCFVNQNMSREKYMAYKHSSLLRPFFVFFFCLLTSIVKERESCSVMFDSLRPHELYSPWNSPGQNSWVGSLSLLQGIFPTQYWTQVSCTAGIFFTSWATREAPKITLISIRWTKWNCQYLTILKNKYSNFHGQSSLAGYSPWGHKESDMTEGLTL